MANTGRLIYTTLVEVDAETNVPTGNVKPNISTDPDYIPPSYNLTACPVEAGPYVTTTTTAGTIPGEEGPL